jgi:hypothetical protein
VLEGISVIVRMENSIRTIFLHGITKMKARPLLAVAGVALVSVSSFILILHLLDMREDRATPQRSGNSGPSLEGTTAETTSEADRAPSAEEADQRESWPQSVASSAVTEGNPQSGVTSEKQSSRVLESGRPDNNNRAQETPVLKPLALLDSETLSGLSEEQVTALNNLRQDFVTAIGGVNQDPTSPEYFKRWEAARAEIDERFSAQFGQDAYNQLSIQAFREAQGPSNN